MIRKPSVADISDRRMPLGRVSALISDESTCSVIVLEFVFRSEDVTVWFGERTLAVMDRVAFFGWLWAGGDLVVDDLVWTVQEQTTLLTIDGRYTYALDAETLALLAERTGYAGTASTGLSPEEHTS
jgi:hypothetical protein